MTERRPLPRSAPARVAWLGASLVVGACGGTEPTSVGGPGDDDPGGTKERVCNLPKDLLSSARAPDAIPALTLPTVEPADAAPAFLADTSRVVGVVIDGAARAYPHHHFWYHEVVNDTLAGTALTVSLCPLTGSALAFESTVEGRQVEFGVSGLLFANNLVLFDRQSGDIYGPQLAVEGRCDSFRGAEPDLVPVRETTWGRWKTLYPGTTVLGADTGFDRPYDHYPYGDYRNPENRNFATEMEIDGSRPPKERVLGLRTSEHGGKAYPFGELDAMGPLAVVNDRVEGTRVAVFYERGEVPMAAAYHPTMDGEALTFAVEDGTIRDDATGSTWNVGGRAVAGPLAGRSLEPVTEAFEAYWFAWRHFQVSSKVFSR